MIELAINSHIPDEILQSQEIKLLWTETTVGCWVINDIVSAKRELGEGFIENAVVLCALDTRKAQDGMDRAVQLVKESIARFDEQARVVERTFCDLDDFSINVVGNTEYFLLVKGEKEKEVAGQQSVGDQVRKVVENCKCIITRSLS